MTYESFEETNNLLMCANDEATLLLRKERLKEDTDCPNMT